MDLSELIRPNIRNIVPYSPGKDSEEVKRELGLDEVIKLASNENPLGPSPAAVEAIRSAAPEVFLYPDPTWRELVGELAAKYDMPEDTIVVGRGSDEIIHMAGLALLGPESEVVYSDPPFALYPLTARMMNCKAVPVPARDLRHDVEALAGACNEYTRLLFISNPYNPTGTIVRQAEVDWLLENVPETTVVVLDEAYFEYADDPEYPESLAYVRDGRSVLVLRTFSKAYGLAGLRVGYGFAPPALARGLKQACEPFNVSTVAQVAAVASLRDPEQVPRTQQVAWAGRGYLYREFDRLGLEYAPTQANFIYLNVNMDCKECFTGLMCRGCTVRTGDVFGMPTWIRVTLGIMEQNQAFIAKLEEVLAAAR
ncbi:MAG TPA: histidinol-phosphate transaminase [Armatimonadota bacterium]